MSIRSCSDAETIVYPNCDLDLDRALDHGLEEQPVLREGITAKHKALGHIEVDEYFRHRPRPNGDRLIELHLDARSCRAWERYGRRRGAREYQAVLERYTRLRRVDDEPEAAITSRRHTLVTEHRAYAVT